MKKTNRLIPLLLACLLLVTLFYNVPIASACEGCTMYDDPDWDPTYDPHPEFRTDDSDNGKFGYLNRNVPVYDTITNEWVELNTGCKVKILVKVFMDGCWTYSVDSSDHIYTDVPVNAIDWTKPVDSKKDNSKPAQTAKNETSQTTQPATSQTTQPANTEKSTAEKNKPSAKQVITVCTADRYRFFADTSGVARRQFPHNMILPVAFGELQMYLR